MTITAFAALLVTASAQSEAAPVNLGADLRSYSEIAAALSANGRHVVVAPELSNRIAVVSFRNRPWSEARSLLEKGLNVAVRSVSEGEWRIEESPEIVARKMKLYSAFLIESDAHYAQIVAEYRKLSHGQYPPPLDRTKAMIDEQLRSTPPRQGTYEGNRLFAASAPWPVIAALALMYGTSSSDVDDFKVSGPALFYVSKGNAVKRLMSGDLVNSGDAYYWRNWQEMPEYVRSLAVAQVRNYESDLAKAKTLTPQQKQAMLEAYAHSVGIAHRLRFNPDRGSMFFEYSVLTDPGINEEAFKIPSEEQVATVKETFTTTASLTFSIALDNKLDTLQGDTKRFIISDLVFIDASPGWYDQARVRALALPMDGNFLKKVETRAEVPDEAAARMAAATQALSEPAATQSFELRPDSNSIGEALVDYSTQTGTDVVAEVVPVRDRRLGAGATRRTLSDLMPWLADVKQDTQQRVKAWTLSFDKGAAIVRDEWAFVDDNYSMPSQAVLKLARNAIRLNGGGRGARYEDLLAYGRSITPAENGQAARFDPPFGVPSAARIYPFINFFEKLGPKARDAFFAALKKDGHATIAMKDIALQSKLALIAELRKVCEMNPDANQASGAVHHSIFHPQINHSVIEGKLEVRAADLKNQDRPLHMLSISLTGPPLTKPSKTVLAQRFFSTGGTEIYREQFGPIELPH